MEEMVIIGLALFPAVFGACLEYCVCRVRGLGIVFPVATGIGIMAFLNYDQRHAEAMLANGQMPEALGKVVGLSILGGLLVGMIFGRILYQAKNNKD